MILYYKSHTMTGIVENHFHQLSIPDKESCILESLDEIWSKHCYLATKKDMIENEVSKNEIDKWMFWLDEVIPLLYGKKKGKFLIAYVERVDRNYKPIHFVKEDTNNRIWLFDTVEEAEDQICHLTKKIKAIIPEFPAFGKKFVVTHASSVLSDLKKEGKIAFDFDIDNVKQMEELLRRKNDKNKEPGVKS